MKTIQEDIDDLDRMVDTGAAKDAIRSQIRLISREVSALEAEYAGAIKNYDDLKAAQAQRDSNAAQSEREFLKKVSAAYEPNVPPRPE